MIRFLKVPKTTLPDFYEKAKFALTWRISIMFAVVLFFLSIATYFGDSRFFIYYVAVLFFSLGAVVYMYFKRTYSLIAKILLSGATIVIVTSVLTVPNAIHLIEALWLLVATLAAFFVLGKGWGVSFLFINTALYSFYFIFLFRNSLDLRIAHSQKHDLMMSIEFAFSMFLIGYIMYQFSLVNSYAKRKSEKAFKQLKEEKKVVERQNQEKTVLLQEIHHRVKNNLQVIISLLRIQSNDLKSAETVQSFDDAISRILTMSLIHQKMYEKESLMNINLSDYLNTLIDDLVNTNSTSAQVDHSIISSIETVGEKTIVPLGLIINELVSNSLKHAFTNRGKIQVKVEPLRDDKIKLTYMDNGKWKENDKNSFGLQLIEVFTDQLEGNFNRQITEQGTQYSFEFANLDE